MENAARSPRLRVAALLAGAGLVGLTACGAGGSSTEETSPAALSTPLVSSSVLPTVADSPSASPDAGLTPLGSANTEMKTQRPQPPADSAPMTLGIQDVRFGSHDGFDRVVVELDGTGEPGWFADYSDKAIQQASGHTLPVAGTTFLNLGIDGISYPFEKGRDDYSFEPIKPGGGLVAEVYGAGVFEARYQLVIGLNGGAHPYSVQLLSNPTRVVVDILHS